MDTNMNESLDLRNRIIKMRESNNLNVNSSNSENNNLMSKFENSIKKDDVKIINSEKNVVTRKDYQTASKEIKKKSENEIIYRENLEKQNLKNSTNENEAQFLMLANKFNEAVEVILQLSEKVEKLEKATIKTSNKDKKKFFFLKIFNLKILTIIIIVPLTILGFFTLPIDFVLLKSIVLDIISNI